MYKDVAIACALCVAVENHTQQLMNSLHNDEEDENSPYMKSDNPQFETTEAQNKHCTKIQSSQQQQQDTEVLPPTLPQDRINASEPKHITLTKDFILQATSFHKSDFLLKHFHTISNNTVNIVEEEKTLDLDEGETATFKSKRRNTTLSDTSKLKLGKVYNMDIFYSPSVGIGGIKHALLLIDRRSKRKFIYGLKNLKGSIQNAMQQFPLNIGSKPRLIRTNFDHKLIGGQTRKMLQHRSICQRQEFSKKNSFLS